MATARRSGLRGGTLREHLGQQPVHAEPELGHVPEEDRVDLGQRRGADPLSGILPIDWFPSRSFLRPCAGTLAHDALPRPPHLLRGRCDQCAWHERPRFRFAGGTSERPSLRAPDGHDAAGGRERVDIQGVSRWGDGAAVGHQRDTKAALRRGLDGLERPVPACSLGTPVASTQGMAASGNRLLPEEVRQCGIQSGRSGATSGHESRGIPGARPRSSSL
jgi:hypothetical protein